MTSGFVGADLANLVNEAALLAARKGKAQVDPLDFEEGVERILAGPEKKQRGLAVRRTAADRLPRGGPCPRRPEPAAHRPRPQGLDPRPRLGHPSATRCKFRPEDDRFLHTQGWLGKHDPDPPGRDDRRGLAVYGEVSDGCTSDLQRASSIARKMVAEFGMSRSIGRVSYQNEGRSPFMAGGGANRDAWSEATAREIDVEVRRVMDEAERATRPSSNTGGWPSKTSPAS